MAVAPTASSNFLSLYVGDLHPDVTEEILRNTFSQFESLASVRLSRDSVTGRSLCYGYVNFMANQDATNAIKEKNHSILNGKMIRVMRSIRDPDARKNGIGNVFVKNLNDLVGNVELEEMFCCFGNIVSCKVPMTQDGKSRCHGFVQFESEDSATAAIEKLNGLNIDGKQIYVGKFIKKSDRVMAASSATKFTNLYVKNLDPEIGEELLGTKFLEFGKIASLVIAKDDNGISKGFGFVDFDNSDDAKRAMKVMNGSQLGSKVLYVARAQKKTERQQMLRTQFEEKCKDQQKGLNLYVKNINDDVTTEDLAKHFSQCGTITSAKIMQNDKGISKGFGFICFSCQEEANKAVNTFHGRMFRNKPLYVANAQRKEERQAQLQHHFAQRKAELFPAGYPSYYYTSPLGALPSSPMLERSSLIYQSLGFKPGWRPFSPYAIRLGKPYNVKVLAQNNGHGGSHKQNFQQQNQSGITSNDSGYYQDGQSHYTRSKTAGVGSKDSVLLSCKLAAASPDHQKQILGDRLYPLVKNYTPKVAAKVTGMLLEMDGVELLHLMESPEWLAAKVEEAVQVLKMSKIKASSQGSVHNSAYLSAEQTTLVGRCKADDFEAEVDSPFVK